MNYNRIYNYIINLAKYRGLDKSNITYYVELHHIIPRSLGGNNNADNLVLLTAKEHYICHHLLYKIHGNKSMALAYWRMSNDTRHTMTIISANQYKKLKETISINMKLNNPMYDTKCKHKLSITKFNQWANKVFREKMIIAFNQENTIIKHKTSMANWISNNREIFNNRMLKINTNISKITKTANTHRGMKRSDSSKLLMSKSAIGKHEGKSNGIWNGYYITPLGKFERVCDACTAHNIKACTVHNRCKYNNKLIIKAQALRNADVMPEYIGKTWNELGWGFIGESNG